MLYLPLLANKRRAMLGPETPHTDYYKLQSRYGVPDCKLGDSIIQPIGPE